MMMSTIIEKQDNMSACSFATEAFDCLRAGGADQRMQCSELCKLSNCTIDLALMMSREEAQKDEGVIHILF